MQQGTAIHSLIENFLMQVQESHFDKQAEESAVQEEVKEQDAASLESQASGIAPVGSSSPTHASSEAIEISGALLFLTHVPVAKQRSRSAGEEQHSCPSRCQAC